MSHWTNAAVSRNYAAFRPTYPQTLFDQLLQRVPQDRRRVLLDLGCGTGQALKPLAPHFDVAVGNDPSATQVDAARDLPDNTKVLVGDASKFTLPNGVDSVDVVTVAQAMHWFDFARFSQQLDAYLRPGGFVFAWLYGTAHLRPAACHDALHRMDAMLMSQGHWPPERKHIDTRYADLLPQMPYPVVSEFEVVSTSQQPLTTFMQYLSTWSGVNRYVDKTKHATLLDELEAEMRPHGGTLEVSFPITVFAFQRPEA